MTVSTLMLVVVVVLLMGTLPAWRYSRNWGYYPSGFLGAVLVSLIVMLLMGWL
jgi:hypothetical protein